MRPTTRCQPPAWRPRSPGAIRSFAEPAGSSSGPPARGRPERLPELLTNAAPDPDLTGVRAHGRRTTTAVAVPFHVKQATSVRHKHDPPPTSVGGATLREEGAAPVRIVKRPAGLLSTTHRPANAKPPSAPRYKLTFARPDAVTDRRPGTRQPQHHGGHAPAFVAPARRSQVRPYATARVDFVDVSRRSRPAVRPSRMRPPQTLSDRFSQHGTPFAHRSERRMHGSADGRPLGQCLMPGRQACWMGVVSQADPPGVPHWPERLWALRLCSWRPPPSTAVSRETALTIETRQPRSENAASRLRPTRGKHDVESPGDLRQAGPRSAGPVPEGPARVD